jgi:hypothetical protein
MREQELRAQKDKLNAQKRAQIQEADGRPDAMEYMPANKKPDVKIRVIEKNYVHIGVMSRHLNADMKSFTDQRKIVKIHAREFERRSKEGAFSTYDETEIIHDPRPGNHVYRFKPEANKAPQIDHAAEKAKKEMSFREEQILAEAKKLDAREEEIKAEKAEFAKQKAEFEERLEKMKVMQDEIEKRLQATEKVVTEKAPLKEAPKEDKPSKA